MTRRHEARHLLAAHQIDDVARALIALTREVWVLTDRQVLLERLLREQGIDTTAIDQTEPDAETRAELDRRRTGLLDAVLGQLRGTGTGEDT